MNRMVVGAVIGAVGAALLVGSLGVPVAAAARAPARSPSTVGVGVSAAPSLTYFGWLCSTSRYSLPRLRNTSSSRSGTRLVQYSLRYLGYNPGPVDGVYGPVTRRAVRAFQRNWGLVVDGYTGPQTWGQLQWLIC